MLQNPRKPFKILSIDGGGIKGIYSSTILEKLEEYYNCKTYDCFDMLCGTSTGGLIALGLSAGKSAKEITEMYQNKGRKIFPQKWNRVIKQCIYGGKYTNKFLKINLEEFFGDLMLRDSRNLLCIPSYNYTESRPCVFKYDHGEGSLARDGSKSYVDVALATSAAPTYFPLHEIESENKQYIDGGVWANDPSLVGVIDALCYFVGPNKTYDSIELLSISSLEVPSGKPLHRNKSRSALKWGLHTLNPFMKGQMCFSHNAVNLMSKHSDLDIKYKRIDSPEISKHQAKQVGMDKVNSRAIDFMIGQGKSRADNLFRDRDIKHFFETRKTYNTKNYGKQS